MMKNEDLLREIKSVLVENFGSLIKKVILFGSRAKGSAREFSDYDMLVVISESIDWRKKDSILDVLSEINIKHDIIIDGHIISEIELGTLKGKQPFIENAFATGIAV